MENYDLKNACEKNENESVYRSDAWSKDPILNGYITTVFNINRSIILLLRSKFMHWNIHNETVTNN